MRQPQYCLIASVLIACCVLAGCSGRLATLPAAGTAEQYGFKLTSLADPMLGQAAPALQLRISRDDEALCVLVSGKDLADQRSVYFELEYDAAQLQPQSVEQSGLAAQGEVLALGLLDCPGRVRCGQVLLQPQHHTGLSGTAELARLRFTLATAGIPPPSRMASTPPGTNASKALLAWDAASATLSWGYTVSGDYNQDGTVAIIDLTPLGMHYGEHGPFPGTAVQSVIDGNGDQVLNTGDLTAIGVNYGRNAAAGYAVFESTDTAQYPAGNTEPPLLPVLATVPLAAATGNLTLDRLQFTYHVTAPVAQAYYFVRPVDNLSACGSPSYTASGNPALLPTLTIVNPPGKGNGSSAAPYWVAGAEVYTLSLLVPGVGDASLHPHTKYFISDTSAGTLDPLGPTLSVDPEWVGDFSVSATFQNTQAVAPVYFYAKPPYTMLHSWVDEGAPASNAVGEYCSMADIAGEPAVAYYDQTTGTPRYAYYTSLPPAWHSAAVDPVSVTGKHCSLLALENGMPAVCYMDQTNQALKVACATSYTPDGPGDWVVHTAANSIYPTELDTHLVNGTIAIVFNDVLSDQMYYLRTYEPVPTVMTDWVWHPVTGVGDQCLPSLEWVDGVPGIAYYDADSMDLRYVYGKTFEPHASDEWVKMAIDSNNAVGLNPQLYAMDGLLPVIAYFDWTNGNLKFAQAKKSKPLSAADWTLTYIDRQPDMVGTRIAMDAVNGRLCIAYKDYTTDGLWFARNKTPYPTGPQSWQVWSIDDGPDVGDYLSLAELYGPASGIPGIAFFNETEGNLEFVRP